MNDTLVEVSATFDERQEVPLHSLCASVCAAAANVANAADLVDLVDHNNAVLLHLCVVEQGARQLDGPWTTE